MMRYAKNWRSPMKKFPIQYAGVGVVYVYTAVDKLSLFHAPSLALFTRAEHSFPADPVG